MFQQQLAQKSELEKSVICLFGLFAIFWFVFGVLWLFPYDQMSQWVNQLESKNSTTPQQPIESPELGIVWKPNQPANLPTLSPEILKSLEAQGLTYQVQTDQPFIFKENKSIASLSVDSLKIAPLENAQLLIPSLGLIQDIAKVPVVSGQWDIEDLGTQVGHLQTTGESPNQGHAMTLVGHATVPWPGVGPFANLIRVEHGEEIIYRWGGQDYVYEVSRILLVHPSSVDSLYEADGEMLILATCSEWDASDREYDKRLVTQAKLVRIEPSPVNNQ